MFQFYQIDLLFCLQSVFNGAIFFTVSSKQTQTDSVRWLMNSGINTWIHSSADCFVTYIDLYFKSKVEKEYRYTGLDR